MGCILVWSPCPSMKNLLRPDPFSDCCSDHKIASWDSFGKLQNTLHTSQRTFKGALHLQGQQGFCNSSLIRDFFAPDNEYVDLLMVSPLACKDCRVDSRKSTSLTPPLPPTSESESSSDPYLGWKGWNKGEGVLIQIIFKKTFNYYLKENMAL